MAQAEQPRDHITDYERAICYYTLPKVSFPLTYGLIVAYTICLLEALGAMVIGAVTQHQIWLIAGATAFVSIVIFGLLVFTVRAFLSELRERRLLATARGVPDAKIDTEELPDPFEGHILLKHPTNSQGKLFACTTDDQTIQYFVDSSAGDNEWRIRTSVDEPVCQIKAVEGVRSFGFGPGLPSRLTVTNDDQELAQLKRRMGIRNAQVEIQYMGKTPQSYVVRKGGIFCENKLVGRMYLLRGAYYLDIESRHLNEGILGYFISRT